MNKLTSDLILHFLTNLKSPTGLPDGVQVMNPYQNKGVGPYYESFYRTFYGDTSLRTGLFGINPGRFGGGITGVPFTDPVQLAGSCGIVNPFERKRELSSTFIYDMIQAFGGVHSFYSQFYISALSPLGFTSNEKNLNYYDIADWRTLFTSYCKQSIQQQLPFLKRDIAFCIGQGLNHQFLEELNRDQHFFDQVIPLPHPRWVMQYRLKQKDQFIREYLQKLTIRF